MKIKDKVLIVEDEQSISNFISMVLNGQRLRHHHCGRSGEEALTMIASHCPDLIVLDLGLPDMDGHGGAQVRAQVVQPAGGGGLRPARTSTTRWTPSTTAPTTTWSSPSARPSCWPASERPSAIPAPPWPIPRSPSRGKFTVGELTIDYDKHQVLIRERKRQADGERVQDRGPAGQIRRQGADL